MITDCGSWAFLCDGEHKLKSSNRLRDSSTCNFKARTAIGGIRTNFDEMATEHECWTGLIINYRWGSLAQSFMGSSFAELSKRFLTFGVSASRSYSIEWAAIDPAQAALYIAIAITLSDSVASGAFSDA